MGQQDIPAPGSFPEPSVGSKFSLTVNDAEFFLAVGRMRMGFLPDGNTSAAIVDYHSAFSLSPTSAKQLVQMLEMGVRQYEENFGPIPQDPKITKQLSSGGERATVRGGKIVPIKSSTAKKAPAKKR